MTTFLTPGELKTHVYEEVANEITRNDDSIINDAIDTAVDEIKGYLRKYDLPTCIDDAAPDQRNKKLLQVCKDVAAWHLITLCNVTIDYDKRRECYEDALNWLRGVQKGTIVPDLPLPAYSAAEPQANQSVKWSSNTKRINHF
jgi:phage gp36-like protein